MAASRFAEGGCISAYVQIGVHDAELVELEKAVRAVQAAAATVAQGTS